MNQTANSVTPAPETYLQMLYEWGLELATEQLTADRHVPIQVFLMRVRDCADDLRICPVDLPGLGIPEHVDIGELLPMQFMRNFPDFDCALMLRSAYRVVRQVPLADLAQRLDASQQEDRCEVVEVKVGTLRALEVAACPLYRDASSAWLEKAPLQRIEFLAAEDGKMVRVDGLAAA